MKLPRLLRGATGRLLGKAAGHADARGRPVQAAALPWRRAAASGNEILLVTGRSGRRWIVPKGWPMRGKTLAEAAAQEAWEEAGVRGVAEEKPLGRFRHAKNHALLGRMDFTILLFPLEVADEAAHWPEVAQRTRRWFAPEAAAREVASPALAKLIRRFRP